MAISTFGSSQQRTGAPTVDYTSILPYMQMAKQVETSAHNQKIADKQAKRQEVAMKADEYRKSNQLRNQNEAKIGAALQANPNLQNALDGAPEEVKKQWDKLQKGSGTLAGSSLVSTYLTSISDAQAAATEREKAAAQAELESQKLQATINKLKSEELENQASAGKSAAEATALLNQQETDAQQEAARQNLFAVISQGKADGGQFDAPEVISMANMAGLPVDSDLLETISELQEFGSISDKSNQEVTKLAEETQKKELDDFYNSVGDLGVAAQAALKINDRLKETQWKGPMDFSSGWARWGKNANFIDSQLSVIQSLQGFGELQSIREASPTGGAVGQVSNMENQLLQSTSGALMELGNMSNSDGRNSISAYMYAKNRVISRQYDYLLEKYGKGAIRRMGVGEKDIKSIRGEMDEFEKTPQYHRFVKPAMRGSGWRDAQALILEGSDRSPDPLPTSVSSNETRPKDMSTREFARRQAALVRQGYSVGPNFTVISVE
jgi:hypothetical protein